MAFALDKRLEIEGHLAVTHKHIQIRLADESRYFWVILVPAITRDQNNTFVSEINDLPANVATDLWSLVMAGTRITKNSGFHQLA